MFSIAEAVCARSHVSSFTLISSVPFVRPGIRLSR